MGLNALDLAIIVAYLLGVTAFGLHFRRHRRTLKDYFLADRQIPWWAISLSIVAAETSTLTIISVPGLAYDTDFRFLQLVMGYVVGRGIISVVLIPQYFRGELVTAYQLIDRRFGQKLRALTAGLFLAEHHATSTFGCSVSGHHASKLTKPNIIHAFGSPAARCQEDPYRKDRQRQDLGR